MTEFKWQYMSLLFHVQMYRVVLVIKKLKLWKQREGGQSSLSET